MSNRAAELTEIILHQDYKGVLSPAYQVVLQAIDVFDGLSSDLDNQINKLPIEEATELLNINIDLKRQIVELEKSLFILE